MNYKIKNKKGQVFFYKLWYNKKKNNKKKNMNSEKEIYDLFAWKVINLLTKINEDKKLEREEKKIYNDWLEDYKEEDLLIVSDENHTKDPKKIPVGIFDRKKLIIGFNLIYTDDNIDVVYFYGNSNLKNITSSAIVDIVSNYKERIHQNNPEFILRKMFEINEDTGKKFLDVDFIKNEIGQSIKEYLKKRLT